MRPSSTASMPAAPMLMQGRVMHHRLRPREHRFVYPMCYLLLPADDLGSLSGGVFSVDRPNLFSLRFADYGARDGSDPVPWVRARLAEAGLARADGALTLQTLPRVLGYAFNPVSFWFCHDRAGALQAVVVEVNNTFGEWHASVLGHHEPLPIRDGQTIAAAKSLHVSPFNRVEGGYRFRFHLAPGETRVAIDYADAEGDLLRTSITGRTVGWGNGKLLAALVRSPAMALAVIVRIHVQALILWLRGVGFNRKPPPPSISVTRSS